MGAMNTVPGDLADKAKIDFGCFEEGCDGSVSFRLADMNSRTFQAVCPKCHRPYELDAALKEKLNRLLHLIDSIREAEDILGDCYVSVNVAGGSVRVPYALLLTRLNTLITLNYGGRSVDFHLRVEPSSPETFR